MLKEIHIKENFTFPFHLISLGIIVLISLRKRRQHKHTRANTAQVGEKIWYIDLRIRITFYDIWKKC